MILLNNKLREKSRNIENKYEIGDDEIGDVHCDEIGDVHWIIGLQ